VQNRKYALLRRVPGNTVVNQVLSSHWHIVVSGDLIAAPGKKTKFYKLKVYFEV